MSAASLWKTTIVIWSGFDPKAEGLSTEDLVRDADSGESYCSSVQITYVDDPTLDPDWDGTEFFADDDLWGDKEAK